MKCIAACETCADACLSEDDPGRMADCIRTDRDCADVCSLTARFVSRNSAFTAQLISNCIDICKACEKECRQHDHDHCQKCAEVCHACHVECEAYASKLAA